ncbi:uncharacterized protein LOC144128186 [Amblyomma americanum]
MAFPLLPLERLSVAQVKALAPQRYRNGFHVYYTGGFDASKKQFLSTTPGYMQNGCVFTAVFKYPGQSDLQGGDENFYPLGFGQFDAHQQYFLQLLLHKRNVLVVKNFQDNIVTELLRRENQDLYGFHVLQFVRENDNLNMFMDGELLIPEHTVQGGAEVDEWVVFYTDLQPDNSPYAITEVHYTMDDVASVLETPTYYNIDSNYAFWSSNVYIRVGGYVLWNGTWQPGAMVSAMDSNETKLAGEVQASSTGELVALLKFYKNSCSFQNANDPSTTPNVSITFKSIPITELVIKPNPERFFEYKAVTGEIIY